MPKNSFYPIGRAGEPWSESEKKQWLQLAVKKRSYQDEVLNKLQLLSSRFDLIQYGALAFNPANYPLFALKTKNWDVQKPTILVTGGVHGYETSGVQGAIQFVNAHAEQYSAQCNIVVLPCISPWGYEHIVRWNPYAVDPNRSFVNDSPSQEAACAMQFIKGLESDVLLHIDLHETTDSDETYFRPALAARDGETFVADTIPDGFYLVGDSQNKQAAFQKAIIDNVRGITHIAPADKNGHIIGSIVEGDGIIYYPVKSLGLCAGLTHAQYTTTTEVYPDSEKVSNEDCNDAQVAAIKAALDFVINDRFK